MCGVEEEDLARDCGGQPSVKTTARRPGSLSLYTNSSLRLVEITLLDAGSDEEQVIVTLRADQSRTL